MVKSRVDNSKGWIPIGSLLFLGSLGVWLTYYPSFDLWVLKKTDSILPWLPLGLLFLAIAAFGLKAALRDNKPTTLLSSHISPMELVALAKSNEEKELARKTAFDVCQAASSLDGDARSLLNQVKAEITEAPTHAEVMDILNSRHTDGISVANPALQHISFALKPSNTSNAAKGILLEIIAWGYGAIGGLLSLYALSLGILPRFSKGILYKAMRMRRRGIRYRLDPQRALRRDNRAPILYLRSFSDDYEDDPENYVPTTSEEKLVRDYQFYGPVVAVGESVEELPLLGATRIYFDDATWRAGVLYLMSISQLVNIEAGFARGLLWELGMARQRKEPERLRISFAGWELYDKWERHLTYLRFKKYAEELLECELPTNIGETNNLSFGPGWKVTTQQKSETWSLDSLQPSRSAKKRWTLIATHFLLLSTFVVLSRCGDIPITNQASQEFRVVDVGPATIAAQRDLTERGYITEAKEALTYRFVPGQDPLEESLKRRESARLHLAEINDSSKHFQEAKRLIHQLELQEREIKRASGMKPRRLDGM